jgi:hypothetical protein
MNRTNIANNILENIVKENGSVQLSCLFSLDLVCGLVLLFHKLNVLPARLQKFKREKCT